MCPVVVSPCLWESVRFDLKHTAAERDGDGYDVMLVILFLELLWFVDVDVDDGYLLWI